MLFLLFGREAGVHSLTGLPGSPLRGPTTKKTKQQQNGFPPYGWYSGLLGMEIGLKSGNGWFSP